MTTDNINAERPTNGLASCGVYARGKFCGNLKVYRPCELLRSPAQKPSRRPLATTQEGNNANKFLRNKRR